MLRTHSALLLNLLVLQLQDYDYTNLATRAVFDECTGPHRMKKALRREPLPNDFLGAYLRQEVYCQFGDVSKE